MFSCIGFSGELLVHILRFLNTLVIFVEPLLSPLLTSGDVCPEFKNQDRYLCLRVSLHSRVFFKPVACLAKILIVRR